MVFTQNGRIKQFRSHDKYWPNLEIPQCTCPMSRLNPAMHLSHDAQCIIQFQLNIKFQIQNSLLLHTVPINISSSKYTNNNTNKQKQQNKTMATDKQVIIVHLWHTFVQSKLNNVWIINIQWKMNGVQDRNMGNPTHDYFRFGSNAIIRNKTVS